MIRFISPENKIYLAQGTVKRSRSVNGSLTLTGEIFDGDDVLTKLDKGWSLMFDGDKYVVTYDKISDSETSVEFDAIHDFFWYMTKHSFYEEWNGSHTFTDYLTAIFKGTEYSYSNSATVSAFEKENWGMKNKLELFNDIIDAAEVEFKVVGKIVYIQPQIGTDLSTIVRKGFNLSDLVQETSMADFATYGRGFGAFVDSEDESKGRLEVEYESPLAKTYGRLEADPIADERYTIKENLLAKVKETVDDSISVSIGLSLYDLQTIGYPYAMANIGDSIMAIDEKLNFKQKIRIISIDDEFDAKGNRIEYSVTCGNLSLGEQHQQANSSISNTLNNIANGKATVPDQWLSSLVTIATSALTSTFTQLSFTKDGIVATNKNDANQLVLLSSAGLGVSTDGGKTFRTAITGAGIVADTISAGTLNGMILNGATINSFGASYNMQILDGGISVTRIKGDRPGQIVFLGATVDANSGYANGFALTQKPGEFLSLNSGNSSNGRSVAVFQIDSSSTSDNPIYRIYGTHIGTMTLKSQDDAWIMPGDGHGLMVAPGGTGKFSVNSTDTVVWNNFAVYNGSKNAAVVTRDGVRLLYAYETAESYFGDIGEAEIKDTELKIEFDPLFLDTVNTDKPYHVFVSSYSAAHVWVSERGSDYFIVHSDKPTKFSWEAKIKRRRFEDARLNKSNIDYETVQKAEEGTLKPEEKGVGDTNEQFETNS